jgi:GTP-binding protein
MLSEFYALGVDELYPVSAEHGYGVNDLMDLLAASFPAKLQPAESAERPIALSIVGRPNVGKSSLINRILGENRLVVSEIPGTTRDAVDSFFTHKGVSYILTDTAGIRRKGRVRHKLEKFSVVRALKSLERCDIALVLFDAAEGVTDQDLTVAGYALEQGRACILLINKWDLMEKDPRASRGFIEDLKARAPFLHFAPAMTISAKTGLRVKKIFEAVNDVYKQYTLRVSTGELNRILEKATTANVPSLYHGKRLKFYYITQVASLPPTFVVFVNHPEGVHFSYRRFLVNRIREMAGLDRIPIRLYFRERSGRREYENKKKRKKKR